jgi:hypothetical protein
MPPCYGVNNKRMEYITASCVISDRIVYKDESAAFENKAADLPDFLLSVYNHFDLQYPRFYKMDNLSKLGWLASELLLKDSFHPADHLPEDIAVVLSNSNSSLDTDYKYWETVQDIPSPSVFVYTLPNIMTGEICIRNKFKGENAFFLLDSFDATFLEQNVHYLLKEDIAQVCITGWVDLLGSDYKAGLFLVEKGLATGVNVFTDGANTFTAKNMSRIFQNAKRLI